jgi:hypothetical protein
VVWAYNDGLRLAPLPVLAAAHAHTYFLQRLHERCLSAMFCSCQPHGYTASLTAAGACMRCMLCDTLACCEASAAVGALYTLIY